MAATITITQLVSEFGTWLGQNQNQIKTLLLQPTESTKYMTRVMQDDEFRTAKGVIDDLVQGFQKDWTPKGTPEFTPLTINHRRHKVDVAFYPDEVMGSWLGFLAAENLNRTAWPITRYIIEKLMMAKIAENRELKMYGTGEYEVPTEGVAQAVGKSMDGFCTTLKAKYLAGTSKINFIPVGTFINNDIVDQVDDFADGIAELYQSISMNIFISNKWFRAYLRRRKQLEGGNIDYKGMNSLLIDGTNLTLCPLPSMAGEDLIFATPKENFIWLTKINDGPSSLFIETSKREVIVYADWHENIDFAIEEAVFCAISGDESSASA
jgi:hypothetical protein